MASTLSSITDSYLNDDALDLDDNLQINSEILYGRATETQQLLQVYQRCMNSSNGLSEFVFVHGVSGIGKTSLIEKLREPVFESQGYFCTGKFFQNSSTQQEPYSAIAAALSDLCDLISQSDDFEKRKRDIREKLGAEDLALLSNAISNVSVFTNSADALTTSVVAKSKTALARFKAVCKAFLHAIASSEHPIVLFIDDIQWMDESSRQLIEEIFLKDNDLKHICFVFAYRDDEADMVADLCFGDENNDRLVDILVTKLDIGALRELVSGVLVGSYSDQLPQLCELIAHRSNGNPFHVLQFIDLLEREGLLQFDANSTAWKFDVEEIRKQTMVSKSIARILSRKIQRLPPAVQETLKIASLLGFRFSEKILIEIAPATHKVIGSSLSRSKSSIDTTRSVSVAIAGGFVEATTDGYQFCHDTLQTAFSEMIDAQEQAELHQIIGEAFFARGDPESMYQAAVHLNNAPENGGFLYNVHLAEANLEAGKFCKDKAAFSAAAAFLRRGLVALDYEPKKWDDHFELAFEMTEQLAQMELVVGDHDRCVHTMNKLLLHGGSLERKLNALVLNVELHMATNRIDDSIAAANQALLVLGTPMPRKVTLRHIVFKLLKVRRMIGRKCDDFILSLPRIQDPVIATALKLLFHTSLYCLSKDEENQSVYAALLATELTLKNGLSPYSSSAFTVYGMAEVALGRIDKGYRFGRLSLRLLEDIPCKEGECNVTLMHTSTMAHWKEPLRDLVQHLDRAMSRGFAVGDVIYGVYATSNCFTIRVLQGMHLPDLEEYMHLQYTRVCDYKQETGLIMWTQPSYQYVLNMQTHPANWREVTMLTGEIMDEVDYMRLSFAEGHTLLMVTAWMFKIMLYYDFGFYTNADTVSQDLRSHGKAVRNHFAFRLPHLFSSLTYFALYRRKRARSSLKLARYFKRSFQTPLHCPNNTAFLSLLSAEEQSVMKRSRKKQVIAAYDKAITDMREENWSHFEGLANERAGFYASEVGDHELATRYFELALTLYREWGAIAKYEWLKEQVSRLWPRSYQQDPAVGNIINIEAQKL